MYNYLFMEMNIFEGDEKDMLRDINNILNNENNFIE